MFTSTSLGDRNCVELGRVGKCGCAAFSYPPKITGNSEAERSRGHFELPS
jgi:hypothetical protein